MPISTHLMSKSRIYNIWSCMIKRCYNPKVDAYKYYGGVGIKVCDEWKNSFISFYNDMNIGYADNLSLDRENPNKDYEKSNCRWITGTEQKQNKRNTMYLTIKGETKRLEEWAKISGRTGLMIRQRLSRDNMDVEKAVFGTIKPRWVSVLDTSTGIYYNSIAVAARVFGMKPNTLSEILSGKRKRNKTSLITV